MERKTVGYKLPGEEPITHECDGFLVVPVQVNGEKLQVQPNVFGLTYDQVARTLMAVNVSLWREFMEEA